MKSDESGKSDQREQDWQPRIFDSLSFPTLVLSPGGEVLAANSRFYERHKNLDGDLRGKSCRDLIPKEMERGKGLCEDDNCPLAKVMETGKSQSIIEKNITIDGKDLWEERVFSPIFDHNRQISHILLSLRDITPLKSLEKKYIDFRELIDKVVESSVSGIIAANRKGDIILMNHAAEELFGYGRNEVFAVNIEDFYPKGVARQIMKMLRDEGLGSKGKLPSTQVNILTKHGEEIPVELTATILYEEDKETATAAIFNDLREKLAVQKKLEEAESQIFQSEKLASLGRLSAGVAHEINNPLTSILLYAGVMREKLEKDHPLSENLDYILEDAERCQEIVKNLLAYSRQTRPTKDIFYLNNVVGESLRLIRDQKLFQKVRVIKELDDYQSMVNADKNQIRQVLINLIINAFDAMDGQGVLTLKTYRNAKKGKAYVEVSDTGSGISTEHLTKIFDPFFTTKEVGKGTGLGLSMAYGIMEENHGSITIKSTGPAGTAILLEFIEEQVKDEFQFMSIG